MTESFFVCVCWVVVALGGPATNFQADLRSRAPPKDAAQKPSRRSDLIQPRHKEFPCDVPGARTCPATPLHFAYRQATVLVPALRPFRRLPARAGRINAPERTRSLVGPISTCSSLRPFPTKYPSLPTPLRVLVRRPRLLA